MTDHSLTGKTVLIAGGAKKLSDEDKAVLGKATDDFKAGFRASDGSSVVEVPADAMNPEDVESETIRVTKKTK